MAGVNTRLLGLAGCVLAGCALALAACGDAASTDDADETVAAAPPSDGLAAAAPTVDGKADGTGQTPSTRFVFSKATDAEYKKIDHAAVPFLSTGPLQRSNDYNDVAPGIASLMKIGTSTSVLLDLLRGLGRWNDVINDDLKEMGRRSAPEGLDEEKIGFEACAGELPFANPFGDLDGSLTTAVACTLQAILPTNDRLIDIVWPDKLTLDLREAPGFPNGRVLDENITDLFFAIAFIKQDLRSPLGVFHSRGECNGQRCDRFVLADLPMNPSNDVPFRTSFPYLAPAHR